ncbi:MAG TPA: tetratricopeptide repeat protein [Candidatus Solibacter sp.]
MTRATRVAALAWLLLPACLSAPQDPWLKITSANFELYTTAGERSGRDLIKHFEQVRSFFTQAFGAHLAAARPARIIAFRNEKEYQPYRPSEFASAFYQPGAVHDFIVMSGASSDHYPVAIHEYTHLMIHQSGMELPPWLNEGLAELYSSLEPRGAKILVGQVIPGRVQVLNSEKWIPLATLLNVDHNSPYYNEKSRAGMFYAESWALVHMLNLEPEYRPHLNALASALKEGTPEAAFAKAYGLRIDQIETALRDYFHATTIHAELFNVQLPKSVDAPEIETGAALPARIALAELDGNTRGRTDQARKAWEQLAKDFPQSPEVEAGWGEFAWQQRKLDDSAAHFARAVTLGCKEESSLLLYARVLGYNRRDKDAAAVLQKAAALYPDSNEINLELGATLVRTANYGAALGALVSVKKVTTPAQAFRLYYNLAYAQYRLGDPARARESLAKAHEFTRIPAEIASLDRLGEAINRPTAAHPAPDSDEPPRMVRRPAPPVKQDPEPPAAPSFPVAEGALENMECGTLARLHVRVDGKLMIFLIPDPTKVSIRNGAGEPVDLQCGVQSPPRMLRLEYQGIPTVPGVTGIVRTLEFK